MKKKMSIIIAGILFLAGLSLLLYPLVANQWNTYRQSRLLFLSSIASSPLFSVFSKYCVVKL